MAHRFGYSAAAQPLSYIRDNSNRLYICSTAPASYSAASNQPQMIVSANVSSADFSISSGATGPMLTIGAKSSQTVEASGSMTHMALVSSSGARLNYVIDTSAKVLASGNAVNIGAWTITQIVSDVPLIEPLWSGGLAGVQAQFDEGWNPNILDSAETAGVNPDFVRFNFIRKASTEPSPGVYNFTQYSPALTKMASLGIQHTMTLFYGSAAWDDDFTGFANFAVAAALWEEANFPGTLAALEIWNEPNGSWPVSSSDYYTMFVAISTAIRAQSSLDHIPLIGPTLWGAADLPYWEAVIALGLLDWIDMASFHHYGTPENLIVLLAPFQAAMASNSKPIYLSEWGYQDAVVERVPQMLSIAKSLGITSSAYFPLRDYAAFQTYGLLTDTGVAKTKSALWAEWHTNIGNDAVFVGRDEGLMSVVHSYAFTKNSATVRHIWATVDTTVLIDDVQTAIGPDPIYVTGDVTVETDPTAEVVLANFITDFSLTQGDPFYYLARLEDDTGEEDMVTGTNRWQRAGDTFCYIRSDAHQHPGTTFKSVRRWVAPAAMDVRVEGEVARSQAGGNGTSIRILHNATVLFTHSPLLNSESWVPYSVEFTMAQGDFIDFEAGCIGGNNSFDDVVWRNALIYQI